MSEVWRFLGKPGGTTGYAVVKHYHTFALMNKRPKHRIDSSLLWNDYREKRKRHR
ncbi:hypothetical protein M2451_001516 [Dysgonomonas sp. PFB1-18]|uniref:hypothetical protein n=1 Tax=unclassified Dysgonomonas TaxID=2630389 RepID=UPI00247669E6|nr:MULTISPECIES: hypothetical protein [unclassified Dysgonomonas]MDH6309026.1 hypothetical protein [Dysgonomonas sp. PF1-14]MDH6338777.1 hypothetical protein [Dysgonomonas sp. PF1-16]MDH6380195.1 hypothetical protein [Dysgonomonas sp. PFB1-18]MDH6397525.1 hypothetical protein [Dysgonomonas sp. PF1-23]